jgi:putative transcriptional regulator
MRTILQDYFWGCLVIRFRVQELLADKQFVENRVITITELASETGISRVTLSKMINQRGYTTGTDNLDRLCRFFGCPLEKLAEYVPDEQVKVSTHGVKALIRKKR